jgi:hypothetical protein
MGNCPVIRPKYQTQRFALSETIVCMTKSIGQPQTRIENRTRTMACVWNIDTGAALKDLWPYMDVNTKEFWQSEPLNLVFWRKGKELKFTLILSE